VSEYYDAAGDDGQHYDYDHGYNDHQYNAYDDPTVIVTQLQGDEITVVDEDHDGFADVVINDEGADGTVDAVAEDRFGDPKVLDTLFEDENGDGKVDAVEVDFDEDGVFDDKATANPLVQS
jgi:hypothetical protein